MDWALSVLKEWDIQEYESAESTWLLGKNAQKIKDGNKLDHHYSHLLSCSVYRDSHLVLDSLSTGPADNIFNSSPYTGMIKVGNRHVDRLLEYAPVPAICHMCSFNMSLNITNINLVLRTRRFLNFLRDLINNGEHPDFDQLVKVVDFPGKVMSPTILW